MRLIRERNTRVLFPFLILFPLGYLIIEYGPHARSRHLEVLLKTGTQSITLNLTQAELDAVLSSNFSIFNLPTTSKPKNINEENFITLKNGEKLKNKVENLGTTIKLKNYNEQNFITSKNEVYMKNEIENGEWENLKNKVENLVTTSEPKNNDEPEFLIFKKIVYMKNELENEEWEELKRKVKNMKEGRKEGRSEGWPITLELTEADFLYGIDLSGQSGEDRQFLEARREVMRERAKMIKNTCKSYKDHPLNTHSLFDQKHTPNIVWCPNYKVASTTWMVNFMKLAHFNDDNPAIPDGPDKENLKYSPIYGAKHGTVYELYKTPITDKAKRTVLMNSLRMIIVRHPFTRVLSAYRDKMIKLDPRPARFKFKELQTQIISKYRPKNSNVTSPFPTFSEFVQHIIDSTKQFTSAREWRQKVRCWTPYWAQCGVCTTDYNVIMKLETLNDDERFLINVANLTELKKSEGEWRHLKNISSSDAAPSYYAQLNTQQINSLYLTYKKDFDLFNYTIHEFLAYAKDAQ